MSGVLCSLLGALGGGVSDGSDPYFADVVLLLHMEGSDASTTFTDSSGAARTVTAHGNAQIDTARFKYGDGGGLFDGTGDYLTCATGAAFRFAADFTIEMWAYFDPAGDLLGQILFDCRASPSSATGFAFYKSGDRALHVYINGSDTSLSVAVTVSGWHHIRLTRGAGVMRVYLDGATNGGTLSFAANFSDGVCSIGIDATDGTGNLNASLDEYRITKGVARTVGLTSFTPPTAAFPDS